MSQNEQQYAGNHRRQQSLMLVASVIGLLFAVAPRQERALFITPEMGVKAFGAAFPPIIPASFLQLPGYYFPDLGTPGAFFARPRPRPAGVPGFAGPPSFGPAGGGGPGGNAPFGEAGPPSSFGNAPSAGGPFGGEGPGFSFVPASFSPPGSSPSVPNGEVPVLVPTPTPTPTTSVTDTPTPVPAVPEPATWLTLIVGFLAVGRVLRDKRRAARGLSGLTPAAD